MKRRRLCWLVVCALGVGLAGAHGAEGDWVARVRAELNTMPSRPRRVMLVFPLVEAGSEEGEIGWGRGLIALQAMWLSSFAPDRLLDTWDFTAHWRFADQQLFGAGRRVTPEKIEAVCAVLDTQNYVTGTLAVDDARYTARLTLHGEHGTREVQHAGPKSELPSLPCLIARDVLAYLRVPITARQQQYLSQAPLSSVELFDEVAERFHAGYYFGATQDWFWESVAERCRTPWTEWEYLYACYDADPHTAMERWEEFTPETESAALDFLRGQIAFGRCAWDEAGRALAPLLKSDPYVPHVVRWLARIVGGMGEAELADRLLDRLPLLYGDSLLGPLHRGLCLINYAWDARGGGWALTVTAEGWDLFRARLARARTDLEQALTDEPRCWVAAAYLVNVAMGLGLGREYCERRLAEATSACPTGFTAYSNMLTYLLPRWHGAREELLEFGRRCAATELYGTGIPGLLIEAHADVASFEVALADTGSAGRIALLEQHFTQPAVWQEVRPVLERTVAENPHNYRDLTCYLAFAYWNDEQELTGRLLDRLPEEAWADGRESLALANLPAGLRAEIRRWTRSGFPALETAVKKGDAETVQKLIAAGEPVNRAMHDGWTPLHVAAQYGHMDIARLLLRGGVDANAAAQDGCRPLHVAAEHGHVPVALMLLASSADVNARGPEGRTPLLVALKAYQDPLVHLLLKRGADPNVQDAKGHPALYVALQNGDDHMIRALAAAGADVNARVAGDRPVLYEACDWQELTSAKVLLELGADPDAKTADGFPSLCTAAYHGRMETARLLIAHGASLEAGVKGGFAALHAACGQGRPEMVKLLLSHGADVHNQQNEDGYAPLHSACRNGHVDCAKLLLEAGADIHSRTHNLWQPLHHAAYFGQLETVRFLLDNGAQADSECMWGTPLHLAAMYGSKELVLIFLERGVDVNAVDRNGRTPTGQAVKEGHLDVAELLRERGGVE